MLTAENASILTADLRTIPPTMGGNLSKRLAELRERQGMSQAHVAKLIGVTRSTISQLESGMTKGPKPQHLLALAKVFNTTVDYIVHGTMATPRAAENGTTMREPEAEPYMVPLVSDEVELLNFIRMRGTAPEQRAALARKVLAILRAMHDSPGDDARPARH